MVLHIRLAATLTFLAVVVFLCQLAGGQSPQDSAVAAPTGAAGLPGDQDEVVKPILTSAEIDAALAAMEADSSLEETQKEPLRTRYNDAREDLRQGGLFAQSAESYRNKLTSAPDKEKEVLEELAGLPSVDRASNVRPPKELRDLEQEIFKRRTTLTTLNEELADVQELLANHGKRPAEINTRLTEVEKALDDVISKLSAPEYQGEITSQGRIADRIEWLAEQYMLTNEKVMLQQESASRSVRESLRKAQQEFLLRRIENDEAALSTLQRELQGRLEKKAREYIEKVEKLVADLLVDTESHESAAEVENLTVEVTGLAQEYFDVVQNLRNVKPERDRILEFTNEIKVDYDSVVQQREWGGSGTQTAKVLFEIRSNVLRNEQLIGQADLPALNATHLAWLTRKSDLNRDAQLKAYWTERRQLDVMLDPNQNLAELLEVRSELLDSLDAQYGNLTEALAEYDRERSRYSLKVAEVTEYIWQQLFWIQTAEVISAKTFADIPRGIEKIMDDRWNDLSVALENAVFGQPLLTAGFVLAIVVLLVMRPRMIRKINDIAPLVRRLSTDKLNLTVTVLALTVALSLPIPLVLGWFAWALDQSASSSGLIKDLSASLKLAFFVSLFNAFVIEMCRSNGLGAIHFRWNKDVLTPLRRAVRRAAVVYVPMIFVIISYHDYEVTDTFFNSAGRISFMIAHLWLAFVSLWLMRSVEKQRSHETGWMTVDSIVRSRNWWSVVMIGSTLLLVLLAGLGYQVAAVELSLIVLGRLRSSPVTLLLTTSF